MKSTIRFVQSNKTPILCLLLITALIFISCGTTRIAFEKSSVVPAAEGSVKVKRDKNENYQIDLNVIRLAEPQRLSPPQNVYVVWMETDGKGTKNIGQIGTSESFLSSTLKSSLRTASTFRPTAFFITAEDRADRTYPSSTVVLRTEDFSINR